MTFIEKYGEKIYAGILGKIIGVYLGRPVEGWSFEKILTTFGFVDFYKHKECGVPLIVADDDISGTFGFFNAIEDNLHKEKILVEDFGNAWLNYIIEEKTILWWGGLGRSTEHTAYLNLKNGIKAPQSGSILQNGKILAEQIGAQIFIDAIAMSCPNNPEMAVDLVRKAASVSHDGIAVEAAVYLGAMEAMAFEEKNINKLLDDGMKYINNQLLAKVIDDVRNICAVEKNWHVVRDYLNTNYGYHIFPGCCHVIPNHAMVLASLLLAEDNFGTSIQIAASAGWDTDCNAGNVGCLNGIRLGLNGIDSGLDFRQPVADRMLVVTADGGAVVTDAIQQTKKVLDVAAHFAHETINLNKYRYSFSFRGSLQGFEICPFYDSVYPTVNLDNLDGNGITLSFHSLGGKIEAHISTLTWIDFANLTKNFATIGSPSLYETQLVSFSLYHYSDEEVSVLPYILYYNIDNEIKRTEGEKKRLKRGNNDFSWRIPTTNGMPIFRFGLSFSSKERFDSKLLLKCLDWSNTPIEFRQSGMLMNSIWNTNPLWLQSWTSSVKHFAADFKHTFCISHPEFMGVVTIGTTDWKDYLVKSKLCFSLHTAGGLVLRAKGHRRFYGAILSRKGQAKIIKYVDNEIFEISACDFDYSEDTLYELAFSAIGNVLSLFIDGKLYLQKSDDTYQSGSAGFVVDHGTFTALDFEVSLLTPQEP